MRRLLALLLTVTVWLGLASSAQAQSTAVGLTLCADSPQFQERLDTAISSFEDRLSLYEPGSAPALYLQGKIDKVRERFQGYTESGLACGPEGLPHLITDGRLDHAGEFLLPGLLFLYLAGWLGWAGRFYLNETRKESEPEKKEYIIDVPLAVKSFAASIAWPLVFVKELLSGELQVPDTQIPVSPR
ncbi:Photosystem I reaction center subunit III [Leptolyngbya sp. FACHB-261]|uniref:Photosystem I reaction center subunit III n=1 Tax=Leptolyngbya sp. FACHB-261 TaxID=2692806 RepID=UPI0016836E9A|nr:Photosystem I reaction center subunit III [Leptolyngbya sp. FACHB-261]MBD2104691.1 Photosystem I reaction center subunit III [Leptolyngbya sp. FACHB-261]